jgi:23S rRNA (cytosine1962-C5)-methyltransferase
MAEIILKTGREKSILRRHPWIYSGAISRIIGNPGIGEPVEVLANNGEFLARASYNPNSSIIGRIWTWNINELIDPCLLNDRLTKAITSRREMKFSFRTDAIRLVHAESDGIPGLILDQYGDTFVVQFLAASVEYWKDEIIDLILKLTNAEYLYERSDVDIRQLEGLPLTSGLLSGKVADKKIIITENEVKFLVDIINGHKTGFYLDQRDNRHLVRNFSNGLKVLDCFSYTGGFAINSMFGQAKSVTLIDSSSQALSMARENVVLNNLSLDYVTIIEQDVFKYLRTLRDSDTSFDLVILDPPKFASTPAHTERAARGYKDINLLALKILKPGGFLMTFSCSGGISEELFQKIIAGAALDAKVDAVVIQRMHQAPDHPVALNFPEGAYLKGFIIQKRS